MPPLPGLPDGVRPIIQAAASSRLLIIGQAPGARADARGRPFDDASGDRLRDWMGIDRDDFYDPRQVAIMPMGFCFPGRGRSGDLPPRPECAPLWHRRLLDEMPAIRLTLLIGQYAQRAYSPQPFSSLTDCVEHWRDLPPGYLPLPHPSPRNQAWLKHHPWFETELLPELKKRVREALNP
ncbi:uracil-DNA glycosylase family protein [Marinobacterium aestuariivivens]|uniref:Uracil-DNA glycosylase family protein n=1 Tax=Marinobacterium aestuariivivens TaxID=1698799 RepID=A0ABW2A8K9_9GAMM